MSSKMNNSTTELQKLPADSSAPVAENRMLPAVLLRIGLSLSKDGFAWYETRWTGKETANSYIVKREKDEEEKNRPAKRVKKESLMIPTTIMYETYKHIAYIVGK